MDAVGTKTFWGLSPPLDLTELHLRAVGDDDAVPKATAASSAPAEGRRDAYLLAQCGDPRHYLKTLARRLRSGRGPVDIFMWEPSAEALVRSLALVAIALDWSIPLRQRAHMFLEVFGNVKVRDRTARYLDTVRDDIISLVCDGEGRLADAVDRSHLSYRDIDDVEEAAKALGYAVPFEMDSLWDQRTRHHYGERFDFRVNVIDWDYQEHVRPSAGLVHPVLFRRWRTSGLAFEFGDETYTAPNRTLAAYTQGRERGQSKLVRGYWGDVVCSPYWALGTAAEVPHSSRCSAAEHRTASSVFAVNNRHSGAEQFRHNAAEVAVLALLAALTEVETGARYVMAKAHDVYSGLGGEDAAGAGRAREMDGAEVLGSEARAAEAEAAREADDVVGALPLAPERQAERRRVALLARASRRAGKAAEALAAVRLVPMLGPLGRALARSKHAGRFSGVAIGCRAAQLLEDPGVRSALAPRAFVVLESARNIVVFKQHQKDEFERRALLMAGGAGLVYAGSERELVASDRFAVGSVIDVRSRAGREAEASKREAAAAADEALRPSLGEHARGVLYLRGLGRWEARRGDNPRPEALVFVWDAAKAEARAAAMRDGAAGAAVREAMLETPAEREAREEEARAARRAAEAPAAAEASIPAPAPRERAGAGAAWTRGGVGKRHRRLADGETGDAGSANTGDASGGEATASPQAADAEAAPCETGAVCDGDVAALD